MEVLKVPQTELMEVVNRLIAYGQHRVGYVSIETPIAIVYQKQQVDEAICEALGYDVCELRSNNGTILCNAGDIAVANIGKVSDGWCDRFIGYFVEWLKSKGLDATTVKNDVLVDGYKVCGMCVNRYGRVDYSGGFIGINTNLEHIKKICRKPMVKVPKGLSEYGITTEEVEQMFLDFCDLDEKTQK